MEEKSKREELERILEENNRKIADAQAKLVLIPMFYFDSKAEKTRTKTKQIIKIGSQNKNST